MLIFPLLESFQHGAKRSVFYTALWQIPELQNWAQI